MSDVLKSRLPAALVAFLLPVALSIVQAPLASAAAGCNIGTHGPFSGTKTLNVDLADGDATVSLTTDGVDWFLTFAGNTPCTKQNLTNGTIEHVKFVGAAEVDDESVDDHSDNLLKFQALDQPSYAPSLARNMVDIWGSLGAPLPFYVDLGPTDDDGDTSDVDSVVFEGLTLGDIIEVADFATYVSVEDRFVYGHAGKDSLWAGNEGWTMDGGPDLDTLHGGSGDDILYGDEGDNAGEDRDWIYGGDGEDYIDGGDGNDYLYGGGNTEDDGDDPYDDELLLFGDHLIGGDGDDILSGEAGNDTLDGGDGVDALYGWDGHDALDGESGADTIRGGNGNDDIHGGDSDEGDFLYGDAGNDTFDECGGGGGGSEATGPDLIDGGAGVDTVDYGQRTTDITVHMPDSGRTTIGNGESGEDDSLKSIENASTGSGDDTLEGSRQANVLAPGDGDDTVSGGRGVDTIDFTNSTGPVYVDLEVGFEGRYAIQRYVLGGSFDDLGDPEASIRISGFENVTGTYDDDEIHGDAAANRIDGSLGVDELYGEGGNDWFLEGSFDRYLYMEWDDRDEDLLFGGAGRDTVDYSGREYFSSEPGVTVALDASGFFDIGQTFSPEDVTDGVENAYGTPGYDYMEGSPFGNDLWGLGGADTIYGVGGRDNLFGGDEGDTLAGGEDNDKLLGGADVDTLEGDAGNDFLYGGGGADALDGGDGNDILDGGAGDAATDSFTTGGSLLDKCFLEGADADMSCTVVLTKRTWRYSD